jgi:hypothetical protein
MQLAEFGGSVSRILCAQAARMTTREIVIRGNLVSEHVIQLFDTADTRADAVAAFLSEGYRIGDTLLVVISRDHWDRVASRLQADGFPIDAAMADGRLTVHDARVTLEGFLRRGLPDPQLFAASMGEGVRKLAASGRRCRIYGEMVDLLAAEGDFPSAQILEDLWNDLSEQLPITLFCGYGAVNFGDPRSGESLRSICRSHSLVRADSRDLLGSFLVTAVGAPRATD